MNEAEQEQAAEKNVPPKDITRLNLDETDQESKR